MEKNNKVLFKKWDDNNDIYCCANCNSIDLSMEKRPDGYIICNKCGSMGINNDVVTAFKQKHIKELSDRIINERTELIDKVDKLRNFINDSIVFTKLEEQQQILLHAQYNTMMTYIDILNLRLITLKK